MNKQQTTKKALSLFEVIIVLAITSLTIVTSVGLLSRNVRMVKNNEMEDFMNGTLLKAVEALKSPNLVSISDANSVKTAGTKYFSITQGIDEIYYLELQQQGSNLTVENCTSSSVFYIDSGSYPYCLQVVVTTLMDQTTIKSYRIKAAIVFTLDGNQKRISEVNLYRYADFKTI